MFRIAICDEDQISCAKIENIILSYCKRINEKMEIEVFYSGGELLKFILKEYCFDLIFIEMNLKHINGITVGKIIRDLLDYQKVQIVYMSKTDKYLMELFNIRPMHFIEKPIESYKIINDIRLAMKLTDKLGADFSYKKGYDIHKLPLKNILYFESEDREIRMVTISGEELFYGKLETIYKQVAKYQFVQIHKSYIINYAHASRLNYNEVIMSNSDCLPISQSRRKIIRELYMEYETGVF
jgi:DNA-binding LytR/AlgR family response regulator